MSDCPKCDKKNNIPHQHYGEVRTNYPAPKTYTQNSGKKWIDQIPFEYQFGEDTYSGLTIKRYLPAWLLSFCPPPEAMNGRGLQDPNNPSVYYKWDIDGFVYRDCYGPNGLSRNFIKDGLIPDCGIRNIDAFKIDNGYKLLKKDGLTTPIDDPQKGYIVKDSNDVCSINPNITLLDIVVTNGCGGNNNNNSHQLKAVISRDAITKLYAPISDYSKAVFGTAPDFTLSTTTAPQTINQIINIGNVSVPYVAPATMQWVLEVHFSARAEGIGNAGSYNNVTTAGISGLVNGGTTISGASASASALVGIPGYAFKNNLSTSGIYNVNQSGNTKVEINISGTNSGNGSFFPQIRFDNFQFTGILKLVKI